MENAKIYGDKKMIHVDLQGKSGCLHRNASDMDEEDDTAYGPYASFDQSAPDGVLLENQHKTTQLIVKRSSGKTITRLKKPRDLYALSRHFSTQMNQRWPSEVPIVAKKPSHIYYFPARPEILYKAGKDPKPLLKTSHVLGKVVYDNSPDLSIKYFTRSKCGGRTVPAKPYYRLQGPDDNTLLFESRFESGNLMRAIKVGDYDYELWLRFDLYTNKHTQWYYFMVQNTKPGVQYRFTIMNFVKAGSLYSDGMRPLLYSEIDAENKGIGWVRTGTNIRYYRNDVKFFDGTKERNYYSLTWTCSFQYENDSCYFAHCYPYTYSDLQDYLSSLARDPARSRCCKQRILCRTLAGNLVYVLTITAPSKKKNEAEVKKAVVITARVHPGETNSSWMMKGFIDYLTSNAQDAKVLRENFIFKIVPMLNPDGVVVGNYRCSLAGRDLNRNYKTVLKDSFPSIWHTRAMIKKLQEEREILMYCDLHGHSRKKNIFIYGCENRRDKNRRFFSRVFPTMLAKNAPDKFSQSYCRFKVQKNREGTGRIFMWNFGIANSFTMEASFCGSSLGKQKGHHFSVADYESIAYHFCDTLLDYCDPDQSKFYYILSEIEGSIRKAILERLTNDDVIVDDDVDIESSLDLLSEIETDSGGSDSSVSDGLPMQLLHASVPELSRKKRLKTRKERNKNSTKNNTKMDKNENEISEILTQKSSNTFKIEKKEPESRITFSAKGRMSYTNRGSSATGNAVPHYVKDRVVEKSKLKKDYLDVLTTSFVSTGADELVDLQEIPHCRFTAGLSTIYQGQKTCATCERCCRSLSEGSDEEAIKASTRPAQQSTVSDVFRHLYGTEHNANTVLNLARRITVYNHRLSQSVSRRRRSKTLSPNHLRAIWQRQAHNHYEDLELSVTSSDSKISPDTQWNRDFKGSSSRRRHFEIRQERRATGNGLYSQSRIEKHFEIKKTSSYSKSGLKVGQKSNSSDQLSNLVGDGITGHQVARRLPHLKRSEAEESTTDGSQTNSSDNIVSFGEALRQASQPPPPGQSYDRMQKPSTGRIDNTHAKHAAEELASQNGRNDPSMLKEKILSAGATGPVSSYHKNDEAKRNGFSEEAASYSENPNSASANHMIFAYEKSHSFPDGRRIATVNDPESINQNEGKLRLLEAEKRTFKESAMAGASSVDTAAASLKRGASDLQIASDKVRRFLNRQDAGQEPFSLGLTREKTDVHQRGFLAMTSSLSAMQVAPITLDSSKPNPNREKDSLFDRTNGDHFSLAATGKPAQQTATWVAEETSSPAGVKQANAKQLLLEYNGSKPASNSFSNRTRTTKLNPPQLKGLLRMSKDSTL